mmetsp:Transcript_8535/g.14392  ORF Transcript_8535/g.14392 Transcript_8535/m.14392 type:complete len:176 (-) Transcript_8535:83-610(-)
MSSKLSDISHFFSFLRGSEIENDIYELLDEEGLKALREIIRRNLTTDDAREYLDGVAEGTSQGEVAINLDEQQKKIVFKVWKQFRGKIMGLLNKQVSNQTQGISAIDWEVHLTTHSRHQSNIQRQSATLILSTTKLGVGLNKEGSEVPYQRDKIMFEVDKSGVDSMLDKLNSVLS